MMNERMLELYTKVVGDDKLNFDSYLAEKFAELIVQECAEWVDHNLGLVDEEAKADLLKHFGVEE
jgi:hypothetical protein